MIKFIILYFKSIILFSFQHCFTQEEQSNISFYAVFTNFSHHLSGQPLMVYTCLSLSMCIFCMYVCHTILSSLTNTTVSSNNFLVQISLYFFWDALPSLDVALVCLSINKVENMGQDFKS